ncbi:MFS transporter [Trichocoleus sp. DQ-A3]|uniref:MFS transporter n=1 Tax=Cyanophyceae TaxID=3028117 RepID=UPI001687151F|nr:MFS transporter [Coleofasciculus sp. FACHB-125]MBD1903672.1 MFS transporter [Coleofasciculus sp. FACHB-125]
MLNRYISLLRSRNFFLIWLGQVFSKLGDSLHEIALVWVAIQVSKNDYFAIGLVFFVRFIPYLIFGVVGGVYSDRFNRKMIMIATDILRGLSVLPLTALVLTNQLELWHLSVVLLILTVLRSFFQPALQSFIPDILKKDQLIHANSLLQASYELAGVVGPIIGGFLLSATPAAVVFAIDSVTFFISAFSIFLISYKFSNNLEESSINFGILSEFKGTLDLLGQRRNVLFSILLSAAAILSVAGILRLAIPTYVNEVLEGDSKLLGSIMGMMAIGTMIGALIAGSFQNKSHEKIMFFGWLLYGLMLGFLGLIQHSWAAILIAHLIGIFGAIVDVLLVLIIQVNMPVKFMGKTFSIFSTLANVGDSISGLLIGYLLTKLQIPYVFVLSSICTILVGILGLYLTYKEKKIGRFW